MITEEVSGAAHFYIGDEVVEAADTKDIRSKAIAGHWFELERIQARFGHPVRRGRKWLRRNNMLIEDVEEKEEAEDESKKDVEAEAKKDDAKKTEAAGEPDEEKEAEKKVEIVEKPKADVTKKRKKKERAKKAETMAPFLINDLD